MYLTRGPHRSTGLFLLSQARAGRSCRCRLRLRGLQHWSLALGLTLGLRRYLAGVLVVVQRGGGSEGASVLPTLCRWGKDCRLGRLGGLGRLDLLNRGDRLRMGGLGLLLNLLKGRQTKCSKGTSLIIHQ